MAHVLRVPTFPSSPREKDAEMTVRVIVMDDDWEVAHEPWLGFGDRLGIAMGCQDCAAAIYEILEACHAAREGGQ